MSAHIIRIAAIAACVVCGLANGIHAQKPQGKDSAQRAQAAQDSAAAAPGRRGGPFHVPLTSTPRFKVEAFAVKAMDESGPDWAGSDEVYAIVQSAGNTMKTETLDGIDTGEQHQFAMEKDCIVPLQTQGKDNYVCNPAGIDGPIIFTVHLYEEDFDWGTVIGHFGPWSTEPGNYDDLIGRLQVTFTDAQLLALMPKVGDTSVQWLRLGGPCGYVPPNEEIGCSPYSLSGTGPDYLFLYQITRLPDDVKILSPQP